MCHDVTIITMLDVRPNPALSCSLSKCTLSSGSTVSICWCWWRWRRRWFLSWIRWWDIQCWIIPLLTPTTRLRILRWWICQRCVGLRRAILLQRWWTRNAGIWHDPHVPQSTFMRPRIRLNIPYYDIVDIVTTTISNLYGVADKCRGYIRGRSVVNWCEEVVGRRSVVHRSKRWGLRRRHLCFK